MSLLAQLCRGLPLTTLTSKGAAAAVGAWQVAAAYSTGAAPSKNSVVHFLDGRDDPDVDAAIREFQKAAFKTGPKAAPEKPEEVPELTAVVQKKYVAATIVEAGIQNINVPLSAADAAPVKRYVQQLVDLGKKAGFEAPLSEVRKRAASQAAGVSTVKELLGKLQPLVTPDYHAALSEALTSVEGETGAAVPFDKASPAYQKFAEKVKKVAAAHKLPVDLLTAKGDEDSRSKLEVWAQGAAVADAQAELATLKAEATALLDKHLSKSADQIKADQAAALATLKRKIEAAKGAAWAQAYAKDLEAIAAYDAAVAADPVNGPKVTVSA